MAQGSDTPRGTPTHQPDAARPDGPPLYLSIHIPKTAGTSIRRMMLREYGERLLPYYGKDHPTREKTQTFDLSSTAALRAQGISVIHGHYEYRKFAHLEDTEILTWVRDPLQRILSQYNHLKRQATDLGRRKQLLPDADMPLEAFIEQPRARNFMSGFLRGAPRRQIVFLGVVEEMDKSVALLEKTIGAKKKLRAQEVNINQKKSGRAYDVREALVKRIEELNEKDFELYERARNTLNAASV